MNRKKKKSPSRTRYEENNPVVSFRVPKKMYDRLVKMKAQTGFSFASHIQAVLNKQALEIDMAYEKARVDTEGLWQVTYPCYVCGRTMIIASDEEKQVVSKYMLEHGWGHAKCINRGY